LKKVLCLLSNNSSQYHYDNYFDVSFLNLDARIADKRMIALMCYYYNLAF
jgi:hypothetical protein